jgi:hypothetical protein
MNCHVRHDLSLFSSILYQARLSEHEQNKLDKYYLIHWSGEYLEKELSPQHTITHQGVTYVVVCCTYTGWPSHSQQCALSFRKPKLETNLPPICLIRII